LRGALGKDVLEGFEARLAARLDLVADVDHRRGVLSHADRREPGRDAGAGHEVLHSLGDLLAHARGDRLSVDDLRRHARSAWGQATSTASAFYSRTCA